MRRAAKRDANEQPIIEALETCGCSVSQINSDDGITDLVVGRAGVNYLLEVKDGSKPKSAQKLTPPQEVWHAGWKGQKAIVRNVTEALVAVGLHDYARLRAQQHNEVKENA